MARKRRNELTAGLFVLGCAAATAAIVIWVGGLRFGGRFAYVTAPLSVGDVSIVVDSPVKLSSVEVGKVDRVSPSADWKNFTFRIRLTEPVDLRQDAVVEATAPTLGGVGSLTVLDAGSAASPPADENRPIALVVGPNAMVRDLQRELGYGEDERRAVRRTIADVSLSVRNLAEITTSLKSQFVASEGASPNMLSEATRTLAAMRETVETVRREVHKLAGQLDPANPVGAVAKAHRTLDNAAAASGEAAAMVRTIRPEVEQAVARVGTMTANLEKYSRNDLSQLLQNLRAGGNELLALLADFRKVSASAREVVTVNNENIHEMVANLTQVSVNLKAASRDIRRHPWKLLGAPSAGDVRTQNIQNAAEAFAEGAAQLDDAIGRLSSLAEDVDRPLPADDPQLELIRQKISDSFENFSQVERALWEEIVR